ncbi:MAG: MOSC domain-containing protein, partial [Gammaproteobacteria bacterium]|nr:MOSC domain-containing protein [Gammaproteobacteria bacterium]
QADLRYHGGQDKAVYAYDISYYEHWKTVLERESWEMGLFGENLTTDGILDHEVKIGSIYQIGTTTLQVIQPRIPCYKVNIRFGLPDMIERFFEQRGMVRISGCWKKGIFRQVMLLNSTGIEFSVTIQDVVECLTSKGGNQEKLQEILLIPVFPERMKERFRKFLN